QFFDVLDTIIPGVYVSATFMGKEETSYKLDIELTDGRKISGKTFIPKPSVFDSIHYWFEETSKDTNAYFFLQWFDGPEQNNYRMVLKKSFFPFLTGWGYGDRFYTFDDEIINNRERPFLMLNPYKYGDTVNIYLTQMGRNEYLFWDSFRNAANNGGPFATPVSVKSNVIGAIGSFTGYALTQEQLILR
ncbi:MAG: DUF4249 domain-containing protein, partial [Bacteroidia bacterium]|nr:DUF4249 domain-containing protein [Bacteroidia bacterium]